MTNYEWLVENKAELVKNILSHSLASERGTFGRCSEIVCRNCDFRYGDCTKRAKEWFEKEHEPLYKKGDIVVGPFDHIYVVKEDYGDDGSIMVSQYDDCVSGRRMSISNIKKKIAHMVEHEAESEV